MRNQLDIHAEALRADARVFTKRNLFFAARRACGAAMSERTFESALRRRLSRGVLPGLLPERCRWRLRALTRQWEAHPPSAVLLVDRRAIVDILVGSGAVALAPLAVVCIDGSPKVVVDWLQQAFRAGLRVPVLYLHDAATVVYPFTLEPLATLLAQANAESVAYADIGLPPLGATPRRFADEALPPDEPIVDLEALPPATLLRYCAASARRIVDEARRRSARRQVDSTPQSAERRFWL